MKNLKEYLLDLVVVFGLVLAILAYLTPEKDEFGDYVNFIEYWLN